MLLVQVPFPTLTLSGLSAPPGPPCENTTTPPALEGWDSCRGWTESVWLVPPTLWMPNEL